MKHVDPREFETPQETILRDAADMVRAGWIQRYPSFDNGDGRTLVCASHALDMAALCVPAVPDFKFIHSDVRARVLVKASEMQPYVWFKFFKFEATALWDSIAAWNDAKERTADQVIAVLDAVREDIAAEAQVREKVERVVVWADVRGSLAIL